MIQSLHEHTEAIRTLMTSIVNAVNYEELSKSIVDLFSNFFKCDLCTVWRRVNRDDADFLELSASIGIRRKPGDIVPKYDLNWKAKTNDEIDGVTAWIAIRKNICLANSFFELKEDSTKPWYGTHRGKWDGFQFASDNQFKNLLGLPVVFNHPSGENKLIAVVKLESTSNSNGFDSDDIKLAEVLLPFAWRFH